MADISLGISEDEPLILSEKTRGMHLHIVGGTGKGKSTLMRNMILQDIENGRGVCVIDPHGNLVSRIIYDLSQIKPIVGDMWQVSLIEPSRPDFTSLFNPFMHKKDMSATASEVIEAMLTAWGQADESATPRLGKVLRLLFLTLMDRNIPLSDALLILQKKEVRESLINSGMNETIADDWHSLHSYRPSEFRDYVDSALNRLDPFLKMNVIKRMFGSTEYGIDFKERIEKRGIVLVNLANSEYFAGSAPPLLGQMLVSHLVQIARLRSTDNPRPFYIYIDECTRYLNDSVVAALNETRKYGLHFVLAHQNFEQLKSKSESVYGNMLNIQNKVVFGGVGEDEGVEKVIKAIFTGTIKYDEFIPNTEDVKVVGYDWEETQSRSFNNSKSRSEGQSESEGYSLSEGRNNGYSASIHHTPTQKDKETGKELSQSKNDYTGAMNIGKSQTATLSKNLSYSYSDSLTQGYSVSYSPVLVPKMGKDKGHRYSLEEQYDRKRALIKNLATGFAFYRFGEKLPDILRVIPFKEPETAEEKAYVKAEYEAYRSRIFERMIKNKEALPSEEIDEKIQKRHTQIREKSKKISSQIDEPESFIE